MLHLVVELRDSLHLPQLPICDYHKWIEPLRSELAGLLWSILGDVADVAEATFDVVSVTIPTNPVRSIVIATQLFISYSMYIFIIGKKCMT